MKTFPGETVSPYCMLNVLIVDNVKDEVKDIKLASMKNPEKSLWTGPTQKISQVKDIFYYINNLQYEDEPNYGYIQMKLEDILLAYRSA